MPEERDRSPAQASVKDGAWRGGFAVASPAYVSSIAARSGTVLAASERMYLLQPGATQFAVRDTLTDMGDVLVVAVEPGRPRPRLAVAGIDSLAIFDGDSIARVRFEKSDGEPTGLAWGPAGPGNPTTTLWLSFDTGRLVRLAVDGSGDFEAIEAPPVRALASDEAGGLAYACLDEETDEIDVWVLKDIATWTWLRRSLPIPIVFHDLELAIAGLTAAVSFELDSVWLTRGDADPSGAHGFAPVEALRGGGPITFEGASPDAALFGAVTRSARSQEILRVDAEGRVEHVAALEERVAKYEGFPAIRGLAWDATRRTLFSAAGECGVMRSTAPGAPSPMGAAPALA